ncbi:hypothetical protein OPT61_g5928 [Boeremia exigua]|uniref:Uncharacterized protein n=1 Tax=Boeremia exigua TaxID=749465 RepID=A0ACC2I8L3_9PLEO|nr:hypothetical protein OPT61_g5928 [Boeremia exigua]
MHEVSSAQVGAKDIFSDSTAVSNAQRSPAVINRGASPGTSQANLPGTFRPIRVAREQSQCLLASSTQIGFCELPRTLAFARGLTSADSESR